MLMLRIILFSSFLLSGYYGSSQGNISAIDSAKLVSKAQQADNKNFISTAFFIADNYMNIEQYDSAQIWLNKIHEILPLKANSINNYFLITRQAEVYYYNNLQQLGLQESRRGLGMAQALNDSLLLADSYNFLGLFYMNIDSTAKSIPFYEKGLLFTRQPPYPNVYISLSKPHHLHGNLAEAYFKLRQYDKSLAQYFLSLQKATAIEWARGIAVAEYGLGDVFFKLNKIDSAIDHYRAGINTAIGSQDIDVALVCYGGLAKCYQQKNDVISADKNIVLGFELFQQNPNINRFYGLIFLNTAIDLYRKLGNSAKLVKALELKSTVETENLNGHNQQIQTILNAGMTNEKRLLNMEVIDARQKQKLANTRLIMALTGFIFLAIGFLVYRYYQNQRSAILKIRHKISQDLHDDIGASLSSLQIYGAIAEHTMAAQPEKAIEMVRKISSQSKEIMENMNDIVWSMKNNNTNNTSLEVKIKNYAANLLSENNINFTYHIMSNAEEEITGITARKNVLLIVKEAMNNIAKYSKAANARLQLYVKDKELVLKMEDDGEGFDAAKSTMGNGLGNMQQRTTELKGHFSLESQIGKGTSVTAIFPLNAIH